MSESFDQHYAESALVAAALHGDGPSHVNPAYPETVLYAWPEDMPVDNLTNSAEYQALHAAHRLSDEDPTKKESLRKAAEAIQEKGEIIIERALQAADKLPPDQKGFAQRALRAMQVSVKYGLAEAGVIPEPQFKEAAERFFGKRIVPFTTGEIEVVQSDLRTALKNMGIDDTDLRSALTQWQTDERNRVTRNQDLTQWTWQQIDTITSTTVDLLQGTLKQLGLTKEDLMRIAIKLNEKSRGGFHKYEGTQIHNGSSSKYHANVTIGTQPGNDDIDKESLELGRLLYLIAHEINPGHHTDMISTEVQAGRGLLPKWSTVGFLGGPDLALVEGWGMYTPMVIAQALENKALGIETRRKLLASMGTVNMQLGKAEGKNSDDLEAELINTFMLAPADATRMVKYQMIMRLYTMSYGLGMGAVRDSIENRGFEAVARERLTRTTPVDLISIAQS